MNTEDHDGLCDHCLEFCEQTVRRLLPVARDQILRYNERREQARAGARPNAGWGPQQPAQAPAAPQQPALPAPAAQALAAGYHDGQRYAPGYGPAPPGGPWDQAPAHPHVEPPVRAADRMAQPRTGVATLGLEPPNRARPRPAPPPGAPPPGLAAPAAEQKGKGGKGGKGGKANAKAHGKGKGAKGDGEEQQGEPGEGATGAAFVSREQYEQLSQEIDKMKHRVAKVYKRVRGDSTTSSTDTWSSVDDWAAPRPEPAAEAAGAAAHEPGAERPEPAAEAAGAAAPGPSGEPSGSSAAAPKAAATVAAPRIRDVRVLDAQRAAASSSETDAGAAGRRAGEPESHDIFSNAGDTVETQSRTGDGDARSAASDSVSGSWCHAPHEIGAQFPDSRNAA